MRHRALIGLLIAALLLIVAKVLLHRGLYGWTLFLLLPTALGALASWCARPKTKGDAAGVGAVAVIVASLGFFALGSEGAICIVMTLPLAAPLGAIGGLLAFTYDPRRIRAGGAAMLLLLPVGTMGWDIHARPPVFAVHTSIEIAAPPDVVWKHVVTFADLAEPEEWYFRAGLAYPKRARIQGSGPGAVRYCEFSTGPFVEPIEVWDEPRLLRFRVTENPPPMHEWSPYAHVLPKHLHGYIVSKQGQFQLTALAGGRTLIEGTTWYQHGLWPSAYWRCWSDAIIHRIHLRVLTHIRSLAEADATSPRP